VSSGLRAAPDFWRLWFVGLVTFLVRWLEMLAVGLFAYEQTGSALLVALLSMLRVLPMALFGAFLGAAADRIERHSALLWVLGISILAAGSVAIAALVDEVHIWHLALVSFVSGSCWAADNPVRRMMIGDVVGAERMGTAMSIDVGTYNASRMAGPALSGVLLAQFGIGSIFWLSTALYAVALAVAVSIRVRSGGRRERQQPILRSIGEGLAWVGRDERMVGVLLITVYFNVFGWPFTSMIPVFGTDYLHLSAQAIGLVASCEGIGGMIGALLVGWLARPRWYGYIYVGAVCAYIVMAIAFALATGPAIAAAVLLASGMLSVGLAAMQTTLVYRFGPVQMRARLLGVLSVCIGTAPIGFLYLGWLAELFAPRTATIALGAQGLLVMLLTRRYWRAVLRSD
jgi:MFS family permease